MTMPLLIAETRVGLRRPHEVMGQLRVHYGEHGTISGVDSNWSVAFDIGKAHARLKDGGVVFIVEAEDDASLALLQWSVAEHVLEYAPGERPDIAWSGGTRAGRPLPYFREIKVVRARHVTPAMRRVTLSGQNLSRFARDGHHVRLLLPARPGDEPVWPVMASDGRPFWPDDGARPVARVYTIRRIDVAAGEIDIDFVLHEGDDMPGARFGQQAVAGDRIGMTGPGGSALRQADRYLFLGDETAIPAIARMVEELPAHVEASVILEIANPAEQQHLAARPGIDLRWLSRNSATAGSTDLLAEAAEAALGAAEDGVFVWGACEHGAARKIRRMLKERGLARDRFRMAAYWRRGMAGDIDD